MHQENQTALLPLLSLTLAVLIWGSSFIAMKYAIMAFHPMVVIFGRMFVASALFALAWPRLKRMGNVYRPGDWKPLLFMALCEPGLYFLFEAYALRYTTASQAGMVTAMLPVMIAVVARFALAERVRPRTWLGFVLCVAGVVWLSAGGTADETSPNPALGNFLEVLAMACATGYMITLKRLSVRYTPWFLTAVQAVVGMVFYLPILLMPFTRMPEALPTGPVLAVVYLGSIVTIGAYGCYNYGLSRIPASQASAFVNLIPVSAAVMGFLFLGERFTLSQMAASAVVLAGLFLTQSGRRRKNAAVPAGPPPSGPDVDNP